MQNIIENLAHLHNHIDEYCSQSGRSSAEVTLLCVSKTKPEEMIKCAYEQGERHFGESYISEAVDKVVSLKKQGYQDIVWHFIGPIQSNKTKHIAAHFDVVESVDRLKILERLHEQRPADLPPLKVLLQVNISKEAQKQGCEAEELPELLAKAATLPNIEVIGLMGVALINADDATLAQEFGFLQTLLHQYQAQYPSLKVLSMGMTDDMRVAIQQGSTEVRVGTAIFGARAYPHKPQATTLDSAPNN